LRFLERSRADLMVLPELFNTGYNFSNRRQIEKVAEHIPTGYTSQKLLEISRDRNMTIVAGIVERRGTSLYNSVIVARRGRAFKYRKVHLFFREKKFFKPGNEFKVFGDLGVMICFDWFFPESARTLMLKGARIIAHPSNLVLPYCPHAMRTRCIENRIFAVTADRIGRERELKFIGRSEIVDTKGRILYCASSNREEVAVREIDLRKAADKRMTLANDIIKDRRRDVYAR
ncbi:MAG TPA: nitrilase-related carbon-nitrogen hydrolase, partial [Candidatus Acidoferrum sp.]|nr:nitrilase-related carbon-nitrogen hydrolase [Candidatus Acidoferrum sp.]